MSGTNRSRRRKKQETRIANELNKCAIKFGQTRVLAGIRTIRFDCVRGIDWVQLFIKKIGIVLNKISSWRLRVEVDVTGVRRVGYAGNI